MITGFFTHKACLKHDTGPGHPEQIARLEVILNRLNQPDFAALKHYESPQAATEQLKLIHPESYIERSLAKIPEQGYRIIDADTVASPGTKEASLRAAGGVCAAVDAVMKHEIQNAFCAGCRRDTTPEPDRAMGFCIFSNVAIAAEYARAQYGLKRVAVLDFDVHHGNGTQAAFWDHDGLYLISSHEWPLYPGTGLPQERGAFDNILNMTLPSYSGSKEFRDAWQTKAFPMLEQWQPEFILISAGFDAHKNDPLASLQLTEDDFAWITSEICARAKILCAGRVVSTLEGGYDLDALAASVAAHVKTLLTG